MSRRIAALAVLAAAVAAAPAAAVESPSYTCATYVTHFGMDNPPPQSCTSGRAPRLSGLDTFRQFHVLVATGEVRATLTCKNQWWSTTDSAVFTNSTDVQTLEVVEDYGMTCVATLAATAYGTVAAGATAFTYRYPYEVK